MALAAACGGDDGNKQSDAGTDSSTPDIDAPVNNGPVMLTITQNGTPMVGVRVHFQAPDSTLIASADTDANGVASALMPNGGYVTAVNPYAGAPGLSTSTLKTIAGVKPGDDLKMSESYDFGNTTVTISAPRITTDVNVVNYHFWTPCNDGEIAADAGSGATVDMMLNVSDSCATSTDVLVTAEDADNDVISYIYAPNVTTTTTVDLSASTYAASTTKMYTIANIPAAQVGASFEQIIASAKGRIYDRSSGGEGTSVSDTFALPAFANALSIGVTSTESAYGYDNLFDWGPVTPTFTVDVGARLLAQPTTALSFDNATRTISWGTGAGVAPDFARADIYITHETPTPFAFDWEIVAPYTVGTVTYPTLPVETIDYNIGADDPVGVGEVVLLKVPGGYDAARPLVLTVNPDGVVAGASGSAALQLIDAVTQPQLRPAKASHKRRRSTWQVKHRM